MRYNTKGKPIRDDSPYYTEHGTYYEAHYSCSECKYKFSVVSETNPKSAKCPGCPKCKENSAMKSQTKVSGRLKTKEQERDNLQDQIDTRSVPNIGGMNKAYKAHEATMQMVMEDYGMTDINDKPHEGENCVSKLPAHLEKQVNDGFGASFGAAPKLTSNINPAQISLAGMKQINSGAFRDQGDVVAMQQKYGSKPKFNIIGHYEGSK